MTENTQRVVDMKELDIHQLKEMAFDEGRKFENSRRNLELLIAEINKRENPEPVEGKKDA